MAAVLSVFLLSLVVSRALTYTQLVNSNTIAVSSSTYADYVASRAVDGNTDQNASNCSHTDDERSIKEAWLRIDLGRVYSVKSVKIWNRADRGSAEMNTIRLRGYSLRVSNDTTVPSPESSCYTDPGNVTLPTVVEEDCERTARYIWIYQSNKPYHDPCPLLAICEVQIFGCNLGLYGPDCNMICSQHCENDICDIRTGTCLYGCKQGYRGSYCNLACKNKTYGQNCSETCGNCLNDEVCHHVNGTCPGGCAAGYKTHNCKTTCNDGEYGVNCLSSCSGHCINGEACNKTDGSCRACEAGYEGRNCNQTCSAGIYGQNCSFSCGACLHSIPCNHINGSCEMGCEPGWQNTETCHTACKNGTYGRNCKLKCSDNCLREECDKRDGSCISCVDGQPTDWILLFISVFSAIYFML